MIDDVHYCKHETDTLKSRQLPSGQNGTFALDDWYNRYYRMVLRRTQNEADAQDIMQDAILVALTQLHRFRGESKLSTWVYGIIKNMLTQYFSRFKSRQLLHDELSDAVEKGHLDHHVEVSFDPIEQLLVKEKTQAMMRAFETLPPDMQQVLEWVALDDGKSLALADELGLSHGTIKSRVSRARALLRERTKHMHVKKASIKEKRSYKIN